MRKINNVMFLFAVIIYVYLIFSKHDPHDRVTKLLIIQDSHFPGLNNSETSNTTEKSELNQEKEEIDFMTKKEEQYRERKNQVKEYCDKMGSKFSINTRLTQKKLVYNQKYNIGYCPINKVASTTWIDNFQELEDSTLLRDDFLRSNSNKLLQISNWIDLWNNNSTTFIIVRHPLARIVSFYYNKLERNGLPLENWEKELAKEIIKYSRTDDNNDSTPTPAEVVKYILNDLVSGKCCNWHWLPFYRHCPLCVLEFGIHARMEDLYEDTLYILMKTGLSPVLSANSVKNHKKEKNNPDYMFWSQVPKEMISQLEQDWAYGHDFKMFDYSSTDYIQKIGL